MAGAVISVSPGAGIDMAGAVVSVSPSAVIAVAGADVSVSPVLLSILNSLSMRPLHPIKCYHF